mmetsp:Transcript_22675/g.63748  ORF Transcript_22675/g.63748 Transcript_22675/m.63748 type:complete len:403 (+) Transcript_22675:117-1325(+)
MIRYVLVIAALAVVVLGQGEDKRCNERGMVYPDLNVCECAECFEGDTCEEEVQDCMVTATSGSPVFFAEYWIRRELNLSIPADYRLGYYDYVTYSPNASASIPGIGHLLAPAIRELHTLYKNVQNPEEYHIVPASGCTALIAAASYARSKLMDDATVYAYGHAPYYNGYPQMTDLMPGRVTFSTSTDLDPKKVVEYNPYPANPTGELREPVYKDTEALVAFDSVYYWPSLLDIPAPLDEDLIFFSSSKFTGHAGSRFGWAMVKDGALAREMGHYVELTQQHVSVDVQYLAYTLIRDVIDRPYELFDTIRSQMITRWERVLQVFGLANDRFTVHSVPGGFYLFLECLSPEETDDCTSLFTNHGIMGIPGSTFGKSDAFTRHELVMHTATFEVYMTNLEAAVLS